jgi:hypothetical protein
VTLLLLTAMLAAAEPGPADDGADSTPSGEVESDDAEESSPWDSTEPAEAGDADESEPDREPTTQADRAARARAEAEADRAGGGTLCPRGEDCTWEITSPGAWACAPGAVCEADFAAPGTLTCQPGARCEVRIDVEDVDLRCQTGSVCHVRCSERCFPVFEQATVGECRGGGCPSNAHRR